MSAPAIDVRGLTKTFKSRRRGWALLRPWHRPEPTRALRGVDLSVEAGELVTMLGPNGAGKTTLLKTLATLIAPTSGRARVLGCDVAARSDEVRTHVGYVLSDERSFYWRLTCRDNLRFFAALQGLVGAPSRRRIDELAALMGLSEHMDRDFVDLSGGQRQRMAIARGMLADPPVLLFDEVTRSLDPGRAARVRAVIRELLVNQANKSVLFTTHDLHEARELSDRVVLMTDGKVDCEGAYEQVEARVEEVFASEADEEDRIYERMLGDRGPQTA